MDYLKFVQNSTDVESLAVTTAEYLQRIAGAGQFALIKHVPKFNPFQVLFSCIDEFELSLWQETLPSRLDLAKTNCNLEHQTFHTHFNEIAFQKNTAFLFSFKEAPDNGIRSILEQWTHLNKMLQHSLSVNEEKMQNLQGNLVSQLLHDVQAIINLQPPETQTENLSSRLEYQARVNENLLFYIRPVDAISFDVPVRKLITSTIQILNEGSDKIELTVSSKLADVKTDAELFAKALREILKNALEASPADASNCKLQVGFSKSQSPFIEHDWLKIECSDEGQGISKDYLPRITEPFFTTKKSKGQSGFGLTIAQKIISALDGHLEINSQKDVGTHISIYLPYSHE